MFLQEQLIHVIMPNVRANSLKVMLIFQINYFNKITMRTNLRTSNIQNPI